jgi:hypothetical protein
MNGLPDLNRSQVLRQQCNRHFAGKRIPDVVGAVQMLTADAVLSLPGLSEEDAISVADALAADVRNIIRERFASRQKGH